MGEHMFTQKAELKKVLVLLILFGCTHGLAAQLDTGDARADGLLLLDGLLTDSDDASVISEKKSVCVNLKRWTRDIPMFFKSAIRGTIKHYFGSMKPCCGCNDNVWEFRWNLTDVRDKLSVFKGRMKSSYTGAKKAIDSIIRCVECNILDNCATNLPDVSHWRVKCKRHKKEGALLQESDSWGGGINC